MSSWDDFKKVAQETVGKAPGAGQYVHVHRDSAFELIADYDALLAERDAMRRDAERWRPLSAPGQIKAGDWLSFTVGGEFKCARVKEVLRPGSDREEVIWNRRKNFYFVTRMALDGSSTHRRVMIAALQGAQP